LAEFRANQSQLSWVIAISRITIAELAKYIDWTPFFQTWQLHGKYPAIFDDAIVGSEAKKLFDDANQLLQEIIDNKLLKAKAVVGFYPANSADDDVLLHDFEENVHDIPCERHGSHRHIEYKISKAQSQTAVSPAGELIYDTKTVLAFPASAEPESARIAQLLFV
jgi:5-methyltetrahydrofolate--homocysteine methyltransferase